MKTMVKLTVLLATLLLLAGVAFAGSSCDDYEFDYKDLDNPENSGTWCVELCFNYGSSTFTGFCDADVTGNLVLFFDSMKKQALWYAPDALGYLKFHGDRLFIFNGIELCGSTRYEIRGHKVDACIFEQM
jgi:hypothetical protein